MVFWKLLKIICHQGRARCCILVGYSLGSSESQKAKRTKVLNRRTLEKDVVLFIRKRKDVVLCVWLMKSYLGFAMKSNAILVLSDAWCTDSFPLVLSCSLTLDFFEWPELLVMHVLQVRVIICNSDCKIIRLESQENN